MMIRNILGSKGSIMDKSKFPPNNVFYNPSVCDEYVYLRNTELTQTHEYNHIVLYNNKTHEIKKITVPDRFLLPTYNAYRGVEDLRIIKHNGHMWFTATSTHATPDMRNVILFGRLDKEITCVEVMNVLSNFKPPAKNINPFVYNDEIHLLDTYDKKIFKVKRDPATEDEVYVATLVKELSFGKGLTVEKLRGSTSPVHLHGNTWGCVVHDVIFNDSSSRPGSKLAYYHYWMEIDMHRGVITSISSPFWCMHWGIEFVSGLRYNKASNELVMYFGVKDDTPCVCTTTLHDVRCGK